MVFEICSSMRWLVYDDVRTNSEWDFLRWDGCFDRNGFIGSSDSS